MKISLITPTPPDISAFGVRSLSAYLRAAGYCTQCLFLPGGIGYLGNQKEYIYQYPSLVLEQIIEICSDSDLIGISFMTQYFDRAVQITQALKGHTNSPIIWGGTHPTAKPLEGLGYADIVCVGEGEMPLLDLVKRLENGENYTDIPNLWIQKNGKTIQNRNDSIVQDLDKLPFMDYDLEGHYIYEPFQGKILPLDAELLKKSLPLSPYFASRTLITYRTLASRGCPHRCSYCASSAKLSLRRRSVKNVIEELETITYKYPFIQAISFFDDTFFAAKNDYFKEFSELYKERIALPFHAQGSPTTITKEKLDCLVQAGLVATEMGIQTGSPRIKKIYRREESNESICQTASLLHQYRHKMLPPRYHIILDNPWETTEDVMATLKLILRIPRPFKLCLSSLTFFPGTELYEKARAEGLIRDEKREIYRKPFYYPNGSYLNILIYLVGFRYLPRWLLKLLSQNEPVRLLNRRILTNFYEKVYRLLETLCLLGRGCKALYRGDFFRIVKYLKTI